MTLNCLLEMFTSESWVAGSSPNFVEELVKRLVALTNSAAGSYWCLKEDGLLHIEYSTDIPRERWVSLSSEVALRERKGVGGLALFHRKLVKWPGELSREHQHDTTADKELGKKSTSIIAMPVILKGQSAFGVLYLLRTEGMDSFTDEEEEILEIAAKLFACALQKDGRYPAIKQHPRIETFSSDEPVLIGDSPAFREVKQRIETAANFNLPILLLGETGTGKTEFAKHAHSFSGRTGKFVVFNCGDTPDAGAARSEIFGHKKGAYTGAFEDRKGSFERASGGTVFLEELGNAALGIQQALLLVLESMKGNRVGDNTEQHYSAGVISATNEDLRRAVEEGRFRQDLYYRIMQYPVTIPPLRERISDIEQLANHCLREQLRRNTIPYRRLDSDGISYLMEQWWPGNIRQLNNVLVIAAHKSKSECIGASDLKKCFEDQSLSPAVSQISLGQSKSVTTTDSRDIVLEKIQRAVEDNSNRNNNGKIVLSRVAKYVGLDVRTLKKYIDSHKEINIC